MLPIYVTDTHCLLWYLSDNPKLSAAARQAFDEGSRGQAKIIVPVIVIAELIFLVERGREQIDVEQIIRKINAHPFFEINPLGLEQIMCLQTETAIPEMHDRMIVCEAILNGARIITKG